MTVINRRFRLWSSLSLRACSNVITHVVLAIHANSGWASWFIRLSYALWLTDLWIMLLLMGISCLWWVCRSVHVPWHFVADMSDRTGALCCTSLLMRAARSAQMLVACGAIFSSTSGSCTSTFKNRLIRHADLAGFPRVIMTMIWAWNERRWRSLMSSTRLRCRRSKRHLIWTSLAWLRWWLARIVRLVFFVHQAVCSCRSRSSLLLWWRLLELTTGIGVVLILLGKLECVLM